MTVLTGPNASLWLTRGMVLGPLASGVVGYLGAPRGVTGTTFATMPMIGKARASPTRQQCEVGAAALTLGGIILFFGHDGFASRPCNFMVTAFPPSPMVPLSVMVR
jgi:hypothetical protein